MRIGYLTEDDAEGAARRLLTAAQCKRIVVETDPQLRPERAQMIASARRRDVILITTLPVLGLPSAALIAFCANLIARGITLCSLDGFTTAGAEPVIEALRANDATLARARTASATKAAVGRGGRKRLLTDAQLGEARAMLGQGMSIKAIAERLGNVPRANLYRALGIGAFGVKAKV
jgi:DNA invertase Pin-like site-specific DNA recombinase